MKEEICMQHNRESIKLLAKAQYNLFSARTRNGLYLLSLLFIQLGFGAVYDFGPTLSYVFLAMGCIMLVNIGATASAKAERTVQDIQNHGGHFPVVKMLFRNSSFDVVENKGAVRTLQYCDLLRLGEDRNFYYLFETTEEGYMVPKAQIKNSQFRSRLEAAAGQKFVSAGGIFSLRLRDILNGFRS